MRNMPFCFLAGVVSLLTILASFVGTAAVPVLVLESPNVPVVMRWVFAVVGGLGSAALMFAALGVWGWTCRTMSELEYDASRRARSAAAVPAGTTYCGGGGSVF